MESWNDDFSEDAALPVEDALAQPGQTTLRTVAETESGWRLDLFLTEHFSSYSRTLLRRAIQADGVMVDGIRGKPAYRLRGGQTVTFTLPEIPRESPIPENIPLDILYEDESLAVVNKPPNMVVHPSRGHWSGTLVGALAFRYEGKLSGVRGPARPGIVHRLDRDTSGAILVAKNDQAHAALARLFEIKKIEKEYFAIVSGSPRLDRDCVAAPIGHHPKNREKMQIARDDPNAKSAETYYEIIERFDRFATVCARPRTGRTHQIRVHLTHAGLPILADRLYSARGEIRLGDIAGSAAKKGILLADESLETILIARQALHARRLTFEHPVTGKSMSIEAPLPADMTRTLDALRRWCPRQ